MEAIDHFCMLRDEVRCGAYERAIRRVVRPGDVVVDLGAGTGILSLMAARAGAAKVYAIERDPIGLLAREIVRANGLEDRIEVILADAATVRLPRRADVLVTETVGSGVGVGEGIHTLMREVAPRLLRKGAKRIPSRMEVLGAPVADREAEIDDRSWEDVGGFDFSPARPGWRNRALHRPAGKIRNLGASRRLFSLPLDGGPSTRMPKEGTVEFRIDRGGRLGGVMAWFRLDLAPGVALESKDTSSWSICLIPFHPATDVRNGDRLRTWIHVSDAGAVTWRMTLRRAGRRPVEAMGSEALAHPAGMPRAEEARPALDEEERRELSVLLQADGRRTLRAIARGHARRSNLRYEAALDEVLGLLAKRRRKVDWLR